MNPIVIKRIYEAVSENDGYRLLVDRIWPRGVSKEKAHLDEWNKNIAPSAALRKWFDHKEERLEGFTLKYKEELLNQTEELNRVREIAKNEPVTLLYAAKDTHINHALVLRNVLISKL